MTPSSKHSVPALRLYSQALQKCSALRQTLKCRHNSKHKLLHKMHQHNSLPRMQPLRRLLQMITLKLLHKKHLHKTQLPLRQPQTLLQRQPLRLPLRQAQWNNKVQKLEKMETQSSEERQSPRLYIKQWHRNMKNIIRWWWVACKMLRDFSFRNTLDRTLKFTPIRPVLIHKTWWTIQTTSFNMLAPRSGS